MTHQKITRLTCILLCALVLTLTASSCLSRRAVPAPEAAAPTATEELISLEVRDISFLTEDNIRITGRVFGKSETCIILSHMWTTDQSSWDDLADRLVQNGYEAMTFDFRGYGKSEGKREIAKIHRDLLAAVKFAREDGAKYIVLIGASMGGTASLFVASQNTVSGVIAISAPLAFNGLEVGQIENIKCAKLFVAGENDGSFAAVAKRLYDGSTDPKKMVTYPTGLHGSDIFDGTYREDLSSEILDFIASNVTGSRSAYGTWFGSTT